MRAKESVHAKCHKRNGTSATRLSVARQLRRRAFRFSGHVDGRWQATGRETRRERNEAGGKAHKLYTGETGERERE
jgi:hypothetical protein